MEPITIPVNTGRIVILGDPHYDQFRKAKMDPFEVDGLDKLDWAGIDALVIAGVLVNVVLALSDIRCLLGARLQALVSEA